MSPSGLHGCSPEVAPSSRITQAGSSDEFSSVTEIRGGSRMVMRLMEERGGGIEEKIPTRNGGIEEADKL